MHAQLAVFQQLQGHTAEVYLHGAHVVSWKDPAGKVQALGRQLRGSGNATATTTRRLGHDLLC